MLNGLTQTKSNIYQCFAYVVCSFIVLYLYIFYIKVYTNVSNKHTCKIKTLPHIIKLIILIKKKKHIKRLVLTHHYYYRDLDISFYRSSISQCSFIIILCAVCCLLNPQSYNKFMYASVYNFCTTIIPSAYINEN